jgi:hypothetical protein
MAERERLRQSLLADAGRGDLLKTIIGRVELRPNGPRMILSLVPSRRLQPAEPTARLRLHPRVSAVSGCIGSVAELASLEGISDRLRS